MLCLQITREGREGEEEEEEGEKVMNLGVRVCVLAVMEAAKIGRMAFTLLQLPSHFPSSLFLECKRSKNKQSNDFTPSTKIPVAKKKKQTIVQWTKWPVTANESPLRLLPRQLMKKLLWSQQREKIRTRAAAVAPNFSCCFRFRSQFSSAQVNNNQHLMMNEVEGPAASVSLKLVREKKKKKKKTRGYLWESRVKEEEKEEEKEEGP